MSIGDIVSLMRGAVQQVMMMAGPILLIALVIGLIISIFQAVTSINEQTLPFFFKLFGILLTIGLLGGFMFSNLAQYTERLFNLISRVSG